jgi:NADH-quinone oxidoreductase subunit H
MMWVRWTLPRLRIDQVMMTCLKYLLPISCVLLLGVGLWQVAVWPVVGPWFSYALAALCVVFLAWVIAGLFGTQSRLPVAGVPSPWAPKQYHLAGKP